MHCDFILICRHVSPEYIYSKDKNQEGCRAAIPHLRQPETNIQTWPMNNPGGVLRPGGFNIFWQGIGSVTSQRCTRSIKSHSKIFLIITIRVSTFGPKKLCQRRQRYTPIILREEAGQFFNHLYAFFLFGQEGNFRSYP